MPASVISSTAALRMRSRLRCPSSVLAGPRRRCAGAVTRGAWQRRLECCRQELSDPALAARPVAAIAARWGFSSAGDFSRVFRAVHGLPPAEYRMSARIVKGPAR
jgi:AraC-like DNA-binding protein